MNPVTPDALGRLALDFGATAVAPFAVAGVELREEVRDMCAANRCGAWAKSWMCPPAVGSLAAWRERLADYEQGLVVQYTSQLEDEFDYESMLAGEEALKAVFRRLRQAFPTAASGLLYLLCGSCDLCAECTYPEAPCLLPELASPSLEAIGVIVTDLCQLAGLPYYYGPRTLTYTGAVLFQRSWPISP